MLKNIGFLVFLFILSFNTNAFADECFGDNDGTPLTTGVADTRPYSEIADIISGSDTSRRVASVDDIPTYLLNQEWSVQFDTGVVHGYSGCGARGATSGKSPYNYNVFSSSSAYSGCLCSLDNKNFYAWSSSKNGSAVESGSTWEDKNAYCRANCAAKCAEVFANNTNNTRTTMVDALGSCPVVAGGNTGGGGEDTPTQIHCDAGSYLPMGATTCQTCDGTNNYCEGGDFYQNDTEDQGIAECPFGYEPNNNKTACSPLTIICEAGEYLPATKTICEKCKDNYYCEEDIYNYSTTENQGLKTCAKGYEPNFDHSACEAKSIHCNDGYYLPKDSLTCAACIGFDYCPENTYNFSATNDQGKNTCDYGTIPNDNRSACVEKNITCPAGKYLPSNSSDEYDCQYCPDPYEVGEHYYCLGGTFVAHAQQDAGLSLCPEYSYSEEESSYCTCNDGYTTDGKIANSTNKTTTTTACVPENSAVYNASYYCDPDTESLGSATITNGASFTLISNTDWDEQPLCEKYGYDFGGWRDDFGNEYSAGDTFTWNYDTDVKFTAIWNQRPVYTVTYSCGNDSTGGFAPDSDNVVYGTQYTTRANTCEKIGNSFLGWAYNDEDLYESGETFTYNYNTSITLVPLWSANTITCQPGFWADGNSTTCNSECLEGYYCGGETYTFDGQTHGLTKCDSSLPAWASSYVYSETGATSENDCKISVAMGMYADEDGLHQCEESFYCPGFSGSVVEFNNLGLVGIEDCSDAQNYKDYGWTHGVTSEIGSTSVNDCKIIVAPATYMDVDGVIHQCPADHYCPGHTYEYVESEVFFNELLSLGANIYECPENTTSENGSTSCHCADGYMLNTNTGLCVAECGAGFYLPTNASACIEVGAGYYSPNGDSARYQCPDGLTTSGSGIGADEYSDCGRVLHIGSETLRMRSVRKTTPSLNVKIGNAIYYGDMTVIPTNINANTNKKLHVKYDDVEQYVHDTTID